MTCSIRTQCILNIRRHLKRIICTMLKVHRNILIRMYELIEEIQTLFTVYVECYFRHALISSSFHVPRKFVELSDLKASRTQVIQLFIITTQNSIPGCENKIKINPLRTLFTSYIVLFLLSDEAIFFRLLQQASYMVMFLFNSIYLLFFGNTYAVKGLICIKRCLEN